MANSLHVKKGDRVKVIAGKDKGRIGEILSVDPKAGRVVVQGVNIVKKHKRETPNNQTRQNNAGGIISVEAPINVSNVQLVVKVDGKEVVTRVGYQRDQVTKRRPDGTEYTAERSVRVARKTGKEI
ncbi:50S ribosomal protein L24 [Propionicimonas sp.]|uniref:50S ribosomal protein L24 n=1 Tax=Propionicimonas sp. TaxID=1955623 RepID=UPI0017BB6022|nr:50S ribosomal protein L24 [Propionicimonas sp.]MBU3977674.1 50S ribosomal protein L24 [Actinomycetota bacterium]MBA3021598.1 50S ribosomal protein L24 [Propionicimonas sp.]MBU3987148.1 50S ribosomal protein L24 [Actinomycetota bacterium]MBU4008969.1 50S ribosomal protein L24 [Actinomycetota bacterium]MBU4065881.1 50S ribosomal protein L24 [Actinomycetota bacterium]